MSRGRFTALVVLLAVGVAAVAFALGLQVLDDGEPDPPPRTTSTGAPAGEVTTSTTAASTTSTPTEAAGPSWIVVVASERDEAGAAAKADAVADLGQPVGVLRSDDYASLNPGLWVAYAGPYPDVGTARQASDALAAAGVIGTYVRCAGSTEQCRAD